MGWFVRFFSVRKPQWLFSIYAYLLSPPINQAQAAADREAAAAAAAAAAATHSQYGRHRMSAAGATHWAKGTGYGFDGAAGTTVVTKESEALVGCSTLCFVC